jgi:hypothetical protein
MGVAEQQRPSPGELVLDHISHFVPDLDAAAGILQKLGFFVTPVSHQSTPEGPVGTANRCVMLERGYLEILAPTLDTPAANRMRASLARHVGVHLACFGTPDAEGEHRRLAEHGFAPQPLVDLSRRVEDGRTVRFKVARPAADAMPEGRIQYVEHLAPECIWTEKHLAHSNGVTGLAAVFAVADDAVAAAARWARFSALLPTSSDEMIELRADRGRAVIGESAAMEKLLGPCPPAPALAGYALSCREPEKFLSSCRGIGLKVMGKAVILPSALGGAWFIE